MAAAKKLHEPNWRRGLRGIMPITFSIDARNAFIRTIGLGYVTAAEVDAHFSELARVWPRGVKLDVLLDLSGCTSLPEISQLRDVVSRIQMLGGRKRFGVCAIVASRELLYGLLRVFELLASQRFVAVRVFRSVPTAMAWLHERTGIDRRRTARVAASK
jgi:hypothetical protein